MYEEIKHVCYKGTRIVLGNKKAEILAKMRKYLIENNWTEITLPIIFIEEVFKDKVGKENNNLMFTFKDRGNRNLCLAPEYTSVVQKLANTRFKGQSQVKLFYVAECFRGEKPQAGRFRQFTQVGLEILNPKKNLYIDAMYCRYHSAKLLQLCGLKGSEIKTKLNVERSMDFYTESKFNFETHVEKFGTASQVIGGGAYENGMGCAIGLDRILSLLYKDN